MNNCPCRNTPGTGVIPPLSFLRNPAVSAIFISPYNFSGFCLPSAHSFILVSRGHSRLKLNYQRMICFYDLSIFRNIFIIVQKIWTRKPILHETQSFQIIADFWALSIHGQNGHHSYCIKVKTDEICRCIYIVSIVSSISSISGRQI